VDHDVAGELRSGDVRSGPAVAVGVVYRGGDALDGQAHLAPDVDHDGSGADRIGADQGALDELMGVTLEQEVVLECSRFALVALDDQVRRAGGCEPGPFLGGQKAAPPLRPVSPECRTVSMTSAG
jgi:hypothetical protein